jgi:hypothetical protein
MAANKFLNISFSFHFNSAHSQLSGEKQKLFSIKHNTLKPLKADSINLSASNYYCFYQKDNNKSAFLHKNNLLTHFESVSVVNPLLQDSNFMCLKNKSTTFSVFRVNVSSSDDWLNEKNQSKFSSLERRESERALLENWEGC